MAFDEKLYAYLNIDHPMVAWEVAIGRLQSVMKFNEDGFGVSLWAYNLLRSYVNGRQPTRLANEFRLESVRRLHYPTCVSRLEGLYFFRSEDQANAALNRWGMPPHYKQYISAVQFKAPSITEVDSEWITLNLVSNAQSAWMHSYWNGDNASSQPLPELLVIGSGLVLNKDLRIEAYKRIYELWPTSTPLLAAACCAFDRCSMENVAIPKPSLFTNDNSIQGKFAINMKDFDDQQSRIVSAVKECQISGECPPVIMPKDKDKIFTLPDLRPFFFEIVDLDSCAAFRSIQAIT